MITNLPYSVEAEQSVLGGLMLDNEAFEKIADQITEDDFYQSAHKLIFKAITGLHREKQPFDMVTVDGRLSDMKELDNAGGQTYIYQMAYDTPSASNIVSYAKIVREHSQRRKLIKFGQAVIEEVQNSSVEPAKIANAKKTQLEDFVGTSSKGKLNVVNIGELLSKDIKPRELLLSPWLGSQSLNMIHAFRGVGKTHISLGIAYAVASGGEFLNWTADKPYGVLFIDGEMPANSLQQRIAGIIDGYNKEAVPDNFKIITPDFQEFGIPDLATKEGQQEIERHITEDIKLIIIDNLSCLVHSGRENESESWSPLQKWALSLRAKGKSVLFIHHSNKEGAQRGTSRKEDVLDTVICLKRPKDYSAIKGALFEVHFEKARHLFGDAAEPVEVQLTTDSVGKQVWVTRSLEQSTFDKVVSIYNGGTTKQQDIVEELGVNKSTISRAVNKARQMGVLNAN